MAEIKVDDSVAVDMNKFSRQNAALGAETTAKLIKMKVLIYGCRSVGIETAKNLALQGAGAITLVDSTPTQMKDTGANFFLFPSDVEAGVARAVASVPRLQELNPLCKMHSAPALTNDLLLAHSALVLTQFLPLAEVTALNEFCRANNIKFFYATTSGVHATLFVDLGAAHVINDTNGERPIKKLITGISAMPKSAAAAADSDDVWLVRYATPDGGAPTSLDHGHFEITEVVGIEGINNNIFKVSHPNGDPPSTIRISCAAGSLAGAYVTGGLISEKKVPVDYPMVSFAEKLKSPGDPFSATLVSTDLMGFSEQSQHVAWAAVQTFTGVKGAPPALNSDDDVKATVEIAKSLLSSSKAVDIDAESVNFEIVERVSKHASVELQPMGAFVGGVLAQEVVKSTGKGTPIPGFLHFSSSETLPAQAPEVADTLPRTHRNDELAAVFGWSFVAKLANLKYFMVGCGALGCEFMKNFALNGLFTGPDGQLVVTDGDRIELSNLARQFLFREHNVGEPKSRAAGAMATVMNPDFKVKALEMFVGPKTEDTFNDDFWMSLDGVCNALDNMEARLYVDHQCVKYEKSLLESGTMGTSGNVDTIAPFKTKTYADGGNAAETGGLPMCTLRNFPHLTDHCIEWARDQFELLFVKLGKAADTYLHDKAAFNSAKMGMAEQDVGQASFDIMAVGSFLKAHAAKASAPASLAGAAQIAFDLFHYLFRDRLLHLQAQFPRDSRMIEDGVDKGPFWGEKKRYPTPAAFNADDDAHLSFLTSATCLFAVSLGVVAPKEELDVNWLNAYRTKEFMLSLLPALTVPEYVPVQGEKAEKEALLARLLAQLESDTAALGPASFVAADFEKDDDRNFHIEWVTAAANLRCDNYQLNRTEFHGCKVIAGKIIAAIATTTAAVCGLVILELFKLVQAKDTDALMNRNLSLATNTYTSFSQNEPEKFATYTERVAPDTKSLPKEAFDASGKVLEEYVEKEVRRAYPENFSVWSKIPCSANLTLKQFGEWLEAEHGLALESWDFVYGRKKTADDEGKVMHVDVSTPVYPPAVVLDYALLPPVDLTPAQAYTALMRANAKPLQKYNELWAQCKEAGAIPAQPAPPADLITGDTTIAQILAFMAAKATADLAAKRIDTSLVSALAGRKFWVIGSGETPVCTHIESDEPLHKMAAIKFMF